MEGKERRNELTRSLAAARAALWRQLVPGWRATGASTYRVEDRRNEVRFLLDYHDWRIRLRAAPYSRTSQHAGDIELEAAISPRGRVAAALGAARHGTPWRPFAWARIDQGDVTKSAVQGLLRIHNILWSLPAVSDHVNSVYSSR